MPRRPGRPSKLTPETRELLIEAFRVGATVKIACGACGIHEGTFYLWMSKGNDAVEAGHFRGQYAEFYEEVQHARNTGDLELLRIVRAGAVVRDPRLALELLARRHPEQYARKDRTTVRHTGHDGGPVKVAAVVADLSSLSSDQLRAIFSAPSGDAVLDEEPEPLRLAVKQGDQ